MPDKNLGQIRADNPPTLPLDGDELLYAVQDGDDTALTLSEALNGVTYTAGDGVDITGSTISTTYNIENITANETVADADIDKIFRVTGASTIDVEIPAGLKDKMRFAVLNRGTGIVTIDDSAVTVFYPEGMTNTLSEGGRYLFVWVSTNTYEAFGVGDSA